MVDHTLNSAREAVYLRFTSTWNLSSAKLFFENEKPPITDVDKSISWIRVTVRQLASMQQTLGPAGERKYQRRAMVVVQVFTPLHGGVKAGDDLAKTAANLTEGSAAIAGLDFLEATIREIGPTESWFQHNVETRFDYYEIR